MLPGLKELENNNFLLTCIKDHLFVRLLLCERDNVCRIIPVRRPLLFGSKFRKEQSSSKSKKCWTSNLLRVHCCPTSGSRRRDFLGIGPWGYVGWPRWPITSTMLLSVSWINETVCCFCWNSYFIYATFLRLQQGNRLCCVVHSPLIPCPCSLCSELPEFFDRRFR